MKFCNLLEVSPSVSRKLGKQSGLPLSLNIGESGCQPYSITDNAVICSDGKSVIVQPATLGTNTNDVHNNLFALVGNPTDEVMPYYKRKSDVPLYWSEVQETPENPALIIMCKAIHLINGVKSYLKILNVNKDCIIAMLVAGAAGFEACDGEVIDQSRCCDVSTINMRKSKRLSPEDLNNMLILKDANGYSYNMDMAVSVYAYYGADMVTVKTIKESCFIFDPEATNRSNAMAAEAERKRQEAEERKKQEELQLLKDREYQKEYNRMRAEKEYNEKRAKAKASKPKSTRTIEIHSNNESGRSEGAELFLSLLNG